MQRGENFLVSSSPCYTFNCLNSGFAPFVRLSSKTFRSVSGSSSFNIHERRFKGQTCSWSLWWEHVQLLSSCLGPLPFVYYSTLVSPEPLFCSCIPPLLSFVHSGPSFFPILFFASISSAHLPFPAPPKGDNTSRRLSRLSQSGLSCSSSLICVI